MKKLLIFIIIVGVLVAVAWKMKWIGIDNTETTTILTFDKTKAEADSNAAAERAKEYGSRAVESAKEAGEKARELGAKAVEKSRDTAKEIENKAAADKK